jgi:hypothetical protein
MSFKSRVVGKSEGDVPFAWEKAKNKKERNQKTGLELQNKRKQSFH